MDKPRLDQQPSKSDHFVENVSISGRTIRYKGSLDVEMGGLSTASRNLGSVDLAGNDDKPVVFLRRLLLACLLVAGIMASTFTYVYTSAQEMNDFKSAFDGQAARLLESFYDATNRRVGAAAGLGLTITSFARSTNQSWPNVTVPDFQERASLPLYDTKGTWIALSPRLTSTTERNSWEAYTKTQNPDLENDLVRFGNNKKNENDRRFLQQHNETTFDNETTSGNTTADNTTVGNATFSNETVSNTTDTLLTEQFPVWQIAPHYGNEDLVLYDQYEDPLKKKALSTMIQEKGAVLSEIEMVSSDAPPNSYLFVPIFDEFIRETIVGSISIKIDWLSYMQAILHTGDKLPGKVFIVLSNSCGQIHTFAANANNTMTYIGEGSRHDPNFHGKRSNDEELHHLCKNVPFSSFFLNGFRSNQTQGERCLYTLEIFPTRDFRDVFVGSQPISYTIYVAVIFVFATALFLIFNCLVERRQTKVMETAVHATSIVDSLFPQNVRDRLFVSQKTKKTPAAPLTPKLRLKSFLEVTYRPLGDVTFNGDILEQEDPIADLFPHTTIMFADIAGFTAWSSEREPHQVFQLLETLYKSFDAIAHRLGVFKVETIGDCYVAVVGLPDPNKDHALVMARFAWECLLRMDELTKELECSLGPGTTDLALRLGLHSGAVTAGVLRGDKSRFQLFGDTMNTASRMESTGKPNCIQVSDTTADLIRRGGKEHWLSERSGEITAKGKGKMQTYWLKIRQAPIIRNMPNTIEENEPELDIAPVGPEQLRGSKEIWGSMSVSDGSFSSCELWTKEERLIDWNTELLLGWLQKVVAHRQTVRNIASRRLSSVSVSSGAETVNAPVAISSGLSIVDEIEESISFPPFNPRAAKPNFSPRIPDKVRQQLRNFVSEIAFAYRSIPFHNFEHASHVTLSANKLLKRLITRSDDDDLPPPRTASSKSLSLRGTLEDHASDLHQSTYGISSDPLSHFAIVFSALIHDVDHTGLTNSQLVKEESDIAVKYKNKSVAEQNSVAKGWDMFMQSQHSELRAWLFGSDTEMMRFRQLVVNSVMATDIFDPDLQKFRAKRWEKAFACDNNDLPQESSSHRDDNQSMADLWENGDRRATSIIEHVIQASDVAHTMQHWHIYRRWNERLFREMYSAYTKGRAERDPSIKWYESELGFFDNYVIPLANKLKECGVFGVSSDEYLSYALENRHEWELKGRDITEEMVREFEPHPPTFGDRVDFC